MKGKDKTKEQLIDELVELRRRVAELEASEAEWKRMREALSKSEGKYRWIFENAREGISIYEELPDGSRKLIDCNPQYVEMSGYSREELMRITDTVKIQQDHRTPEEKAAGIEKDRTGQPFSGVFSWRRPDGKENYIEYTAAPLYMDGRRFTIGIDHDITEHKRADEELIRLYNAVNMTTDGVVIGDLEAKIMYVNEATLRMYGTDDKGDLIGRNSLDLIAPEGREKAFTRMAEVLEKGYVKEEYHIITKDGSRIPVEMSLALMKDADGKPIGFVAVSRDITNRKRTEAALAAEKEHLAVTLRSIGDGVITCDTEGKVVLVNQVAEKLTGWTEEEAIGKPLGEVFHIINEDTRERCQDPVKRVLKTGRIVDLANRTVLIAKDGTRRIIADSAAPIRDKDSNVIGVVLVFRDVTERKKAEKELRASEEKLRRIIDASPDSITVADLNGKIIECNQAALNLNGCSAKKDLIGKNAFDLIAPEDRQRAEKNMERTLKEESVKNLEYTILTKDGRKFQGELSASVIRNSSNEPTSFVAIVKDITERKRTEEALRESEEKYRILVENANEIIVVAQDGVLKFANPKAMEFTGYSKDELTSRSFIEFVHPDDREMVAERHAIRLKGGQVPYTYDLRIIDKDENIKWAETSAAMITWDGRPATLNFLNDVTEKRKMEEEALKIEKLESIGVLAGGIAHDFNNILTAVLGNISLVEMYLETGRSRSEILERLEEAGRASVLAKDLTYQLLTFSKGGAPIKELANIGEVLKDSVTFALRGSSVSCRFSIPDALWPVEVDKNQLSQVIANLVINADQAMPEGGVIRVSAENVTIVPKHGLPLKAGEYIEIAIADQGIGIPREHLQRIFDPFFTTKQKGSGLGLATSYSIIKKHDGYIAVESQVGAGSTFRIYLPASSEKIPMKDEKKEEEKLVMGEGKVLVMDDEEYIRDLAGEILGNIGYKVTTSTDGAGAVELYKEAMESGQPYSAVIVDLTVPGGMSGKETIQKLKEIDPEVRAIVSSGYSNDPIMADFGKYGFQGVLTKPYKPRDLSEILREVVIRVSTETE